MLILLQLEAFILMSSVMGTLSQTTHGYDEPHHGYLQMELMKLLDDSKKGFVSQGSDFILSSIRNQTNEESLLPLTLDQYCLLQTIWALSTGHLELAETLIDKTLLRFDATSEQWLESIRFNSSFVFDMVKSTTKLEEGNYILNQLVLSLSRKYDIIITAAERGDDEIIIWLRGAGLDLRPTGSKAVASAWVMDRIDTVSLLLEMGAIDETSAKDVANISNSRGETLLHLAASKGSQRLAKLLLDGGALVDRKDADSLTPLYHAVRSNGKNMTQLLLRRGADLQTRSSDGNTLLHLAVIENTDVAVSGLLELGLNIESVNNEGLTPLFLAAERGLQFLMELLIRRGADANIKNTLGNTLLHVAVNRQSLNAVQNLVSRGASINSKNSEDLTPLYLAANVGSPDIIRFLLNKGAARRDSVSEESLLHVAARRGDVQAIEFLVNFCISVDEVDKSGLTPLYSAASTGKRDAMELLLFKGADLYITLRNGLRLLHVASTKGNVVAIESLLKVGIYVDVKDTDHLTPLCRAIQNDNIVSVGLLIERGANTSFRTTDGDTLLHIAAAYNSVESINLLVEHGLYIEAENGKNETPLYIAVKNNNTKTANLLITLGANKNYVTLNGGTLAHLAASTNDFVALKTLINIRADFNVIDENGYTPLYTSIRKSELSTANIMLQSGVDLFYMDLHNDTLLHLAGRNRDHKAIDFLINKGIYIDFQGGNGSRPIDVALYNGNCDTAEYFVMKGANVRGRNRMNQTVLHSAVIGDCNDFLKHIVSHIEITDTKDENMQTPLHLAAVLGRTQIAKTLITLGSDVNSFDKFNSTPFQIAAVNGNWDMVSSFLTKDINLKWCDVRERTLLHLAALDSRENIVAYLTEGLRVDLFIEDIDGQIPLHLAAEEGRSDIMRYLTDERVPGSIDYRNNEEKTALHVAAIRGHESAVEFLLGKGADPKATDRHRTTPLFYAAKHHNWNTAERLMTKVCEVSGTNDTDEEDRTILHLAVLDKKLHFISSHEQCLKRNIHDKDSRGQTPLDIALTMKNWDIFRYFFDNYKWELDFKNCYSLKLAKTGSWNEIGRLYHTEVRYNCRDIENRTLLHLAAWHASQYTLLDLLRISISDLDAIDINHRTPLHLAAIANRTDIVRILLEHGARKDIYDKDLMTPLTIAFTNKDWVSALQLMNNETDILWNDAYNRTLLHYAIINGQLTIINYLLDNTKIDIDAKDINLNTPLQLAVAQSNLHSNDRQDIINRLVHYGADWSKLDKQNRSLLHLAAISGDAETLRYILIRYKLDINRQDVNSQAPLHIAVIKGHYHMISTLLRFGAERNVLDTNHSTPLVYAIKKRRDAVELLDDFIDTNWTDTHNRSILHLAAMHGCYNLVQKLSSLKKINIDQLDINEQTPLHLAVRENDSRIVELLLLKGANGYILDKENRSPLNLAVISNSWSAVEKLLIRGYYEEARYDGNRTLLHLSIMKGLTDLTEYLIFNEVIDLAATDDKGDTPLHIAARMNDRYTFQRLLFTGVKKDVLNGLGQNPLAVAMVSKSWDVVDVLLKDNCDVEGVYQDNRTILHLAAMYGKEDIMDHLFSCRNVDFNALDSNHNTPLDLLLKSKNFNFLRKHNYINWRDGRGRTVLHHGWLTERPGYYHSFFRYVLIDAVDNEKQTPLHVASSKGVFNDIKELLRDGASINALDNNGHSPVHLAAMSGDTTALENDDPNDFYNSLPVLINSRDLLGRTPLQLSIDKGHKKMTILLKKLGGII